LDKDECLETLSAKVQMHAKDCLIEVVDDFDNLWNGARAQEGESCQWGMPSQQQRTLDWQLGVEELDRVCRAFGKFGCSASFDGQQWIVYHLRAWQQAHQFTVGDVVHKTSTEMIVAASDGLVSILYFEKAR
jgi:methionyl-tRNA formyltransferase